VARAAMEEDLIMTNKTNNLPPQVDIVMASMLTIKRSIEKSSCSPRIKLQGKLT
jgi:hypothetical protein